MPAMRLSMRKIREVLRLKFDRGLSNREIALACSIGRTTVHEYLERAGKAGLKWPVDIDDEPLDRLLFKRDDLSAVKTRPLPDWAEVHKELKRKGVTLCLLWQEYKAAHLEGYQYTQFCEHYRTWLGSVDPVMRQKHKAGEKLFVDYAGQTVPVVDPQTGQIREAQLFLAVLGASSYIYAEATWTQSLPDWIGSHVRALEYLGGVPEVVVPDNLKSGVTSPCRYEPELNPTYREFASHYSISVVPARVRKPRDKAKVENGVLQAERWILAPLRNRTFFELAELNSAIRERLIEINKRPFQKLEGSRATAFEKMDRPALRPLPQSRYEYAEWKRATLGPDYHVEVDGHYYSVPCRLIRKKVDLRITGKIIECFYNGVRVASHLRSRVAGDFTTVKEHMPPSHRHYMEQTPENIIASAERIGQDVRAFVKAVLNAGKQHLGVRSSLGVLRLAKEYGADRLGCACQRALALQALSARSVESILKTGLDRAPLSAAASSSPLYHENLRGPHYFN
jgi:transposase